jgi:hypothetical protein
VVLDWTVTNTCTLIARRFFANVIAEYEVREVPVGNIGRSVAKFHFGGKIRQSGISNSMGYRPPNARKSNFATEPCGLLLGRRQEWDEQVRTGFQARCSVEQCVRQNVHPVSVLPLEDGLELRPKLLSVLIREDEKPRLCHDPPPCAKHCSRLTANQPVTSKRPGP